MVIVLAELGLARLGDIPGLTAVGAAAILAEAGDPCRYDSSSSLVKHAGLSPAENASGAFSGQAHVPPAASGPAAGRVARGLADAPVQPRDGRQIRRDDPGRRRRRRRRPGCRRQSAGSRQVSATAAAARARRAKARVACAASLLRWIYSMAVHDTSWDAAVASGDAWPGAPRAARRRQPDQRLHPARTRHGCPGPSHR